MTEVRGFGVGEMCFLQMMKTELTGGKSEIVPPALGRFSDGQCPNKKDLVLGGKSSKSLAHSPPESRCMYLDDDTLSKLQLPIDIFPRCS